MQLVLGDIILNKKTDVYVGFFVLAGCGILLYIMFFLGAITPNAGSYNTYDVYFKNVFGLEKRAPVKIFGVKVGCVQNIELLIKDEHLQNNAYVKVTLSVAKKYTLYKDAHAVIRQETLLGARCIDLEPGISSDRILSNKEVFEKVGEATVSIDELFSKVEPIMGQTKNLLATIASALQDNRSLYKVHDVIQDMHTSAQKCGLIVGMLEHSLKKHDKALDNVIKDTHTIIKQAHYFLPLVQNVVGDIKKVTHLAQEDLELLKSIGQRVQQGGGGFLGKLLRWW